MNIKDYEISTLTKYLKSIKFKSYTDNEYVFLSRSPSYIYINVIFNKASLTLQARIINSKFVSKNIKLKSTNYDLVSRFQMACHELINLLNKSYKDQVKFGKRSLRLQLKDLDKHAKLDADSIVRLNKMFLK